MFIVNKVNNLNIIDIEEAVFHRCFKIICCYEKFKEKHLR